MNTTETQQVLEAFGTRVIKEARTNLTKSGKNASKELYNSFNSEVKVFPNSFQFTITAKEYWKFQNYGVSGIETKWKTEFSYKDHPTPYKKGAGVVPPASAFDKWNIIRGRAGRSTLGTFLPRKSLNFATAIHVYKHGIKPTKFFTTPFERAFKRLPQELIEAYALDSEKFLKQAFKQ